MPTRNRNKIRNLTLKSDKSKCFQQTENYKKSLLNQNSCSYFLHCKSIFTQLQGANITKNKVHVVVQ